MFQEWTHYPTTAGVRNCAGAVGRDDQSIEASSLRTVGLKVRTCVHQRGMAS